MEPSRPKPSMRERLNISRLAIQFPRLTIATWIAISIAGLLALSSLKFALFPDITFPVVVVTASTPLKTAVDTEKQVTIPLEQVLNGLEPVTGVSSTTYPGQSVINARFEVGTNLETAVEQVEASLKPLKSKLCQLTSTRQPLSVTQLRVKICCCRKLRQQLGKR